MWLLGHNLRCGLVIQDAYDATTTYIQGLLHTARTSKHADIPMYVEQFLMMFASKKQLKTTWLWVMLLCFVLFTY